MSMTTLVTSGLTLPRRIDEMSGEGTLFLCVGATRKYCHTELVNAYGVKVC